MVGKNFFSIPYTIKCVQGLVAEINHAKNLCPQFLSPKTAIDWAKKWEHSNVVQILEPSLQVRQLKV